ncbi:MAG: CopY family transcriptional regulator [Alteromonadaceae bacterium]|nr:MAG: CopY family transcriptional regulator [Alteromonadaceae bacterium]
MENLSRRQRQIMDILFRESACSAEDIREHLPDAPSNSAVRAMLSTMVKKGYIKQREENFRYVYSAAMKQEIAQKTALDGLINTFFAGSPSAAVSALLGMQSEKISAEELDELSSLIEKAKKK